jgi:uncharacterized membrane protein YqgA involved in biofilm formation
LVQHLACKNCLNKNDISELGQTTELMKQARNKIVVFLAITIGTVIGMFKGEEAKQKWVFKLKTKYENKRLVAQRKTIAKKGGVQLDDIELAAYHNN